MSLRTPQTVPPTPGTALQNKIESKLEKSLGNQFNIQLQQQMGVFQASMLQAMKSLREEMQSMKKASEAEVDKTSTSISKAGPSKLPDPTTQASEHSDAQAIDTDFCGPSPPPRFTQSLQSDHGSKHSDLQSDNLDPQSEHSEQPKRMRSSRAKKHSDKKKHKDRAKCYSQSSSSEEDQSSVPVKKSAKPQQAPSEHDQQQDNTDLVFYREVDMSDLPSQYAEEVETFRHILDLSDPRETICLGPLPLCAGPDDEKGQQELRPRGPSAILPLNPCLKDASEKFEQDFLASNLPEGKNIKRPCFNSKILQAGTTWF